MQNFRVLASIVTDISILLLEGVREYISQGIIEGTNIHNSTFAQRAKVELKIATFFLIFPGNFICIIIIFFLEKLRGNK